VVLTLLLCMGILWLGSHKPANAIASSGGSDSNPRPAVHSDKAVGCLGHIEPQDGVLQVTAPYFEGHPQRVIHLNVKEGDLVHAGQLLATLDGKEQLQSSVNLAEARVELARSRLAQVKGGASSSEIAAQRTAIDRAQASLTNAQSEYRRFEALQQQKDVSAADLEARRLIVQTDEQNLEEAKQRFQTIAAVRPTDVAVAESELDVALAELRSAQLNLKSATVYAPASGRIVAIHAHAGEEPGQQGLLELGKTDSMYVVAEVYETDIARIRQGQNAIITSDLFPGHLSGSVERVGDVIAKAAVLPVDPVAFADARIFKVWIRLQDGQRAAGLIHGRVNVVIHP
jgi:HlyD family secretion protein